MATPAAPRDKHPGKYQTPRVPIQTPMYDAAGNMTRTWVIFFERLAKVTDATVDQLEQKGVVTDDYEEATFVLYDTTIASNVTNLLPVRRGGTLVDCEIVPKNTTAAAFTCDIFRTLVGNVFGSRTSIFGTTKLVVPSGTAQGTVINQPVFASNPYKLYVDDVLSMDITVSGGADVFTVVLKWKV